MLSHMCYADYSYVNPAEGEFPFSAVHRGWLISEYIETRARLDDPVDENFRERV